MTVDSVALQSTAGKEVFMANRNFPNAGRLMSGHVAPVFQSCSFIVDSTNGNGLGIRSLKGPHIANVFMNTSSTPGVSNGVTNPNPAPGFIYVQFQDNYYNYLAGFSGCVSPLTGSNLTSTTAGDVYVITALGTTTAAQWAAAGVPNGQTAAVGMAFVAIATGAIGGTGSVKLSGVSGIQAFEVIGDANQSISAVNTPGIGAYMIIQCLGATNSSTTTPVATAPAAGTVIGLSFIMSNSSVPTGTTSGT